MNKTSFIIQGVATQYTAALTQLIRKNYPGAEIVQSTNIIDAKPEGICDKFVVVDDPGTLKSDNNRNLNRQIATTVAGIRASSGDIIVKLRSDILLTKGELIDIWAGAIKYYRGPTKFPVFDEKILICNYYTVDPASGMNLCFHPSDWLVVGNRNDVLKLYDHDYHKLENEYSPHVEGDRLMYRPEQYLWIKSLHKFGYTYFNIDYDTDCHSNKIENTYQSLIDNFIIFDKNMLNIVNTKYPHLPDTAPFLINFQQFEQLWNKYAKV